MNFVLKKSITAFLIIALVGSLMCLFPTQKAYADPITETATTTYNVKLSGNKGKIADKKIVSVPVTVNAKYGNLPKPTRSKFMFKGWYTAKTGGVKVTKKTTVTNPQKHTLYAQWVGPKGKGKTITTKEFKRIKNGMTNKEVKFIIGAKGAVNKDYYADNPHYVVRIWTSKDKTWSATVIFKDGKVSSLIKQKLVAGD